MLNKKTLLDIIFQGSDAIKIIDGLVHFKKKCSRYIFEFYCPLTIGKTFKLIIYLLVKAVRIVILKSLGRSLKINY